jgi:hypothetical protein
MRRQVTSENDFIINKMTIEEAKFILQAYRPGGQDAELPEFEEALQLLEHNEELKTWFEEEHAIDQAIAQKFSSEKPPEELLTSILVANKIVRPAPPAWTGSVLKWGVALFLISAILVAAIRNHRSDDLAYYRSEIMAHLKIPGHSFDHQSSQFGEIMSWLDANGMPSLQVEPIHHLTSLPTHGCKVMDWDGQKVTLICFELTDRRNVHLFVFHQMKIENEASLLEPHWQESDGWTTVGWTKNSDLFMLAGKIPMQELRQFL